MRFKRTQHSEPEINLIPFIDILLVVVIFLMLSTTYSQPTQIKINLPVADTQTQNKTNNQIVIQVTPEGGYVVQGARLGSVDIQLLKQAISSVATSMKDPGVIIQADALATHQSVVRVMDAAQQLGLARMIISTQRVGAR